MPPAPAPAASRAPPLRLHPAGRLRHRAYVGRHDMRCKLAGAPGVLRHAGGSCRGTGAVKINEDALDCLQALRDLIGKPMIVLSGYRSPEHNRRVGGASASK